MSTTASIAARKLSHGRLRADRPLADKTSKRAYRHRKIPADPSSPLRIKISRIRFAPAIFRGCPKVKGAGGQNTLGSSKARPGDGPPFLDLPEGVEALTGLAGRTWVAPILFLTRSWGLLTGGKIQGGIAKLGAKIRRNHQQTPIPYGFLAKYLEKNNRGRFRRNRGNREKITGETSSFLGRRQSWQNPIPQPITLLSCRYGVESDGWFVLGVDLGEAEPWLR